MITAESKLRVAVKTLQSARKKLHADFPEWNFTLDGKLIGDIGEAYAKAHFSLVKIDSNSKAHDFKAPDGRLVQVKITQKKTLGLGISAPTFDYFIALCLSENGDFQVVYNGKGSRVYKRKGHPPKKSISVIKLKELNKQVDKSETIPSKQNTK
ncbi:MAG: hypothetical protein CVU77_02880 [Elusimicrobia bacterium HGW-Elusimicrobia-1]|jgi:hypothetical protein|nr:MAG: hypothetical protein CVU77_02880 [Elusimicrobia bacterium HGW-Elusimicrobia-1]